MIKTQCTNPIFIIGCPRSGTTLLASILNRHSQIASGTETHFFDFVSRRNINWKEFTLTSFTKLLAESRIQDFIQAAGISKEKLIKNYKQDPQSKYQSKLEIDQFYKKEVFDLLMNSFLDSRSKARLCENTPQHLCHIEEILTLYPQAKFIHLIRDGRDTIRSLMQMPWRPKGLLNNARFWVQNLKEVSKTINKLDTDSILEIRYEELVTKPEESLELICDFLEEKYEPGLLDNSKDQAAIYSNWESSWKQKTRTQLNTDSINSWQTELDQDSQALLNWYLKDILTGLGYEAQETKLTNKQKLKLGLESLSICWRKLVRTVLNFINR
ncbi:MAG: sulfotransferase [Cyanobacteria bacterium]|nr:sulfotransferase [Cyanobacteriota bacterium]